MKVVAALLMTTALTFTAGMAQADTSTYSAPAKVYKWVDDKGQVHYAEHAPINTKTELLRPETGHSDPVTYTASGTSSSAASSQANNKVKDPERCESARKNAETLKSYAHIKFKEPNGEYRVLTPEEQAKKLEEANKAIEESCD